MRCNAVTDSELLMENQPSAAGFSCRYLPGSRILRADFRFAEHLATLHHADGSTRTVVWDEHVPMDVYTQVYGVGISPDGRFLFVPSWEKGIACLSTGDGCILWEFRKKHARQVFCYDEYLVCFFEGEALLRISYAGEELQRLPFTGDSADCWMLADGALFIGPMRRKFMLLHPADFSALRTFPKEAVTGTGKDPFLIWNATGTGEEITLHCWHNDIRTTRELRPDAAL